MSSNDKTTGPCCGALWSMTHAACVEQGRYGAALRACQHAKPVYAAAGWRQALHDQLCQPDKLNTWTVSMVEPANIMKVSP